jgi:hypothetical protein
VDISLKRALKLRKELEATLSRINLPATVSLSLLVPNPAADIAPANKALWDAIDDASHLSKILATLRKRLTDANVAHGIEDILADMAHIDRQIAINQKLASLKITPDEAELRAEIELSKKEMSDTQNGYGRRERTIQVSVVNDSIVVGAKHGLIALKRKKIELEDERAAINASNKITIDEDDAAVLRDAGLI